MEHTFQAGSFLLAEGTPALTPRHGVAPASFRCPRQTLLGARPYPLRPRRLSVAPAGLPSPVRRPSSAKIMESRQIHACQPLL